MLPPFAPDLAPIGVTPFDFRNLESPFPKDVSYQIWLKSVPVVLEKELLKENFY